ncbi:glycolate oxidase subunit GlcE [Pseudoduganella umbonata]|uniref:Glycolate oxidase FAD binding subunit n=1 Tax=Pseudoduganella umbonata TaxID=864828 RepID=A0A4P8HII3_9BURK|nr:glycolate oxidase subunit GlcE [Pseudoduganella umbonata]MBB3219233.1 glycolate oxidase FAD binding subunit [Pseudoduganella umbonata]QCP09353.1 glycolate oxidase subunit GlcE [Pseudoduganella umbonata]
MNDLLDTFRARVLEATVNGQPLRIRGGGSKDWYGRIPQGALLDTTSHRGITSYEPTELVVTARCGTPLREIEAALAAQGQMLAFEPPHFGAAATVGGVVASGLAGPRRQAAGAVRDFVLGATLMNGQGEVLRFGGQVMKNVAGYDVSRLLAGSLGMLGLILDVSLKVLPRPAAESTLRMALDEETALRHLNAWAGQPLPVSASAWHAGVLTVRLSGAGAAVAAAAQRLGGETVPQAAAEAFWHDVREQRHAFFAADPVTPLWRLSVPTMAPALAPGTEQLIEWGGGQRWLLTDDAPESVRALAARHGGHATLYRGASRHDVFHPLAPAVHAIHRNLKNAFDPAGIFNPGRMYGDL